MINNPAGWGVNVLTVAFRGIGQAAVPVPRAAAAPVVQRIHLADLRWALRQGARDFAALRADVMTLCVFYPLMGLVLARLASGTNLLPLVFPLLSGFALVGPVAAVGLNEMSRRREAGLPTGWTNCFTVVRSPAIGAITLLAVALFMLLLIWLFVAYGLYQLTLGPKPPASVDAFLQDVLFTREGWLMTAMGIIIGFDFAAVALAISAVSFPLLLDRHVPLDTAVRTSIMVVAQNPLVMAVWGMTVTAGLILGSIPALAGLIVVLPILGHATWHLYRRAVA